MNNNAVLRIIVIATRHEFQRFQKDNDPGRDAKRIKFHAALTKIIASKKIDLIAEEAGDDKAVAEHLTNLGYPQEPQETSAKQISRKFSSCEHIDIRPADGEQLSKEQYEQAMFDLVVSAIGSRTRIMVIVGNDHRDSLCFKFKAKGFEVLSCEHP